MEIIDGARYEEQHVHSVYEQIASHFSSTRYKVCVHDSIEGLGIRAGEQ